MSKSAKKKRIAASMAASVAATKPTQQPAGKANNKNTDSGSKQSRVIEMLRSPAGTSIAAMMKATGWQQHSVRGFLAGVVRKRLKLELGSKKVDGNRIYQIASRSRDKAATPHQSKRRSR